MLVCLSVVRSVVCLKYFKHTSQNVIDSDAKKVQRSIQKAKVLTFAGSGEGGGAPRDPRARGLEPPHRIKSDVEHRYFPNFTKDYHHLTHVFFCIFSFFSGHAQFLVEPQNISPCYSKRKSFMIIFVIEATRVLLDISQFIQVHPSGQVIKEIPKVMEVQLSFCGAAGAAPLGNCGLRCST